MEVYRTKGGIGAVYRLIFCYTPTMRFHKSGTKYLVKIEKGEEILSTLKQFCKDEKITIGSISGIGAATKVELAYFDIHTKAYETKVFTDDYEVLGMHGNISKFNGDPAVHVHISIGDRSFNVFGGHLNSAVVSVTLEITIDTMEGIVERKRDPECGLNLLDL